MLSIKPGALITGLTPEMSLGNQIVSEVFNESGYGCTITETMPTVKHKKSSKHNTGNAIDYRTYHIPLYKQRQVRLACLDRLDENFDVVLHKTHLHVEFDPK